MSPEIRAMLEAKHKERQTMSAKAKTGTKKRKKGGKKRRKAPKKAKVGIRTLKELDIALKLRKHGKPTVKSFRAKY